jgi:hypothetical protein
METPYRKDSSKGPTHMHKGQFPIKNCLSADIKLTFYKLRLVHL